MKRNSIALLALTCGLAGCSDPDNGTKVRPARPPAPPALTFVPIPSPVEVSPRPPTPRVSIIDRYLPLRESLLPTSDLTAVVTRVEFLEESSPYYGYLVLTEGLLSHPLVFLPRESHPEMAGIPETQATLLLSALRKLRRISFEKLRKGEGNVYYLDAGSSITIRA